MLPQTSRMILNRQSKPDQPDRNRFLPNLAMLPKRFKRVFSRLRISEKIGYGYALAIGIAIFGTAAGLGVGDYFRRQALQQLTVAKQQQELLQDLQNAIFQARSHASRLPAVLGNSLWLKSEYSQFSAQINRAKNLLSEIKSFTVTYHQHFTDNSNELEYLLNKYNLTLNYLIEQINLQLKQSNSWNLKPNKIESAQLELLKNNRGEEALILDQLSEQLTRMIAAANLQKLQGAEAVEDAEALRLKIIIGSMLSSTLIAAALAYYTSRAIAQPLETVTQVAQQAARESNFNLRSPVTTEDEVGILAASFNQLIQRVADYTQELKQTQTQLIQTEKMSSLGQMVAGVAHEINNPINFIQGNIDYADNYIQDLLKLVALYQQQYPAPTPVIQETIEDIELDFLKEDLPKTLSSLKIGADRIRELAISLRNFSRLDESEMKPANIHDGIDSTLVILNYRIKQGINLVKNYGNLPTIECYPAQLNQVFMNIISNAIDALEEAKDFGSSTKQERKKGENSTISIHTEATLSNFVTVRIKDNGPGIEPAILENIFAPFFTTKSIGKGTGLGLAICYQIITKHQGTIEVNSQLGQGTEFTITLPIASSS